MNCSTKRRCVFMLFCINYGSAVLGNIVDTCTDDVFSLFHRHEVYDLEDDQNLPMEHFKYAFENFNLDYFGFRDFPTNRYARGYFNELVKCVEPVVDAYVFGPAQFCIKLNKHDLEICYEAIYELFGNKGLDFDEGIAQVLAMTLYAAFEYVYLHYIHDHITFYEVFPPEDGPRWKEYRGFDKFSDALDKFYEDNNRKHAIFRKMWKYLAHLHKAAEALAEVVTFTTVDQYCRAQAHAQAQAQAQTQAQAQVKDEDEE